VAPEPISAGGRGERARGARCLRAETGKLRRRIHPEVRAPIPSPSPPLGRSRTALRGDRRRLEREPVRRRGAGGAPVSLARSLGVRGRGSRIPIRAGLAPRRFGRATKTSRRQQKTWRKTFPGPEGRDRLAWEPKPRTFTCVKPAGPTFERGCRLEPGGPLEEIPEAARLGLLGDRVTDRNISPGGVDQARGIPRGPITSREHGVKRTTNNSYGSRRGNHDGGGGHGARHVRDTSG